MRAWIFLLIIAAVCTTRARAQSFRLGDIDFRFEGMGDIRLVHPSDQENTFDGGLGKTRWGSNAPHVLSPELGGAYLRGIVSLPSDITVVADIRSDTQQQNAVDLIDAYARWRPVSTTRWRWSVKSGAFFVPVSLENTGIGWTSPWTLTPSAINSWIGDELRTIGGETTLEWRGDVDHLEMVASVYAWNQPAGVAMAERGWVFDDHPTALFDRLRLPDLVAQEFTPPGQPVGKLYANEFTQIDRSPGWYAGIAWERDDIGRIALLRYDNEANPAAFAGDQFAWRTKFWSLGYSTDVPTPVGDVVVLAQAMVGTTTIAPSPSFASTTGFQAGYVLVGLERETWRYALRVDQFATDQQQPGPSIHEHGTALTGAVTWSPHPWLRVVGEVLMADYWRSQRSAAGLPPHAVETQAQLALQVSF